MHKVITTLFGVSIFLCCMAFKYVQLILLATPQTVNFRSQRKCSMHVYILSDINSYILPFLFYFADTLFLAIQLLGAGKHRLWSVWISLLFHSGVLHCMDESLIIVFCI